MRFEGGYLRLGVWRGVPIRAHWSTPLGALFFSRFQLEPGLWIGILLVILIHEMGHAILVRWRKLHTTSIEIHALGGVCRYSGWPTPLDNSIIAWGGVLFQVLLAGVTWGTFELFGFPASLFAADLADAFVYSNLYIAALNLLPIPGLDGWEAWQLFVRLPWKTWRRRLTPRQRAGKPEDIIAKALEKARPESRARSKDSLH